jgi:Protein of unknown function (DUF2874).
MKNKLLIALFTTCLAMTATAQDKMNEKDLPAAVKTGFKNEFPNAKTVEWKMKEGKYKAKFEVNGINQIASFGKDGKLIAKGMRIRQSEIPTPVATAVKSAYANRTIDHVYRVDKNGAAHYLIKLDGEPETKLQYTANGQVATEKMDF